MIKFKRFAAAVISVVMLASMLPQALAADAVEYYFADGSKAASSQGYSGEALKEIYAASTVVPTITHSFELAKSGTYDIWISSLEGVYKPYTGFKMNDETEYTAITSDKAANAGGSSVGIEMAWHKVGIKSLSAGANTLDISAIFIQGESRYVSAVRSVAVVPRSYNWDPTKTATPEQCETPAGADYFYKNATEADYNDGYTVREDDQNENRMQLIADRATAPKLYFDVYLNNSGVYDIWLDSTASWWH